MQAVLPCLPLSMSKCVLRFGYKLVGLVARMTSVERTRLVQEDCLRFSPSSSSSPYSDEWVSLFSKAVPFT